MSMKYIETSIMANDGKSIHLYKWLADPSKASIVILHGMAEHAMRYDGFAKELTSAGYDVYAPDHRGHGKTAAEDELGWLAEKDGFTVVIQDIHTIVKSISEQNPNKKIILFGHSWGSFLAQGYMAMHGNSIHACVLSGTAGNGGAIIKMGKLIALLGCAVHGQKAKAPLMDKMSFGAYNKAFKPNRTSFDWLSADTTQVDKYINDPLCGFVCSYGFFRDMLTGLSWIHKLSIMQSIPKKMHILIVAGDKDPVGNNVKSVQSLVSQYKKLGLDITLNVYKDGRHELLNDLCSQFVVNDILAWLNKQV